MFLHAYKYVTFEHGPRNDDFRITLTNLIIEALATRTKFLEPSPYVGELCKKYF